MSEQKKWLTENGHSHNMTVRIPQDDYNALKLLAAREDTTVSKLVQESVRILRLTRDDFFMKKTYERILDQQYLAERRKGKR